MVALAPLIVFQVYALRGDRADSIALAHERAADFAAAGAERFRDTIDDARTTLDLLTNIQDVASSGESCNKLLMGVKTTRRWVRTMWVIDEDGKTTCSTNPEGIGIDVRNRDWYQRAVTKNGFILSDFYRGQLRNLPVAIAATAHIDPTTGKRRVFAATLELRWFDSISESLGRRIKGGVALLDSKGVMLSVYPMNEAMIGKDISTSEVGRKILADEVSTFEASSLNGVPRLYATHPVQGTEARLVIGFDRDAIMAPVNAETSQAILVFILVGLIVAGSVWLAGSHIFVRPFNRLDELLRTTLETMDQGLIVVDAQGNVPFCNRRAREMLDLPDALMSSYPHTDEVFDYQVAQGEFAMTPEELHPKLRPRGNQQADTYERERPNGRMIQVQTVPLGDGGVVRTYTDITLRRSEERALGEAMRMAERAKVDAENASAAKSDFLASMSHEIRTPLNGIMGFAEVLSDQTDLTGAQRRYIDLIRGAGSALLTVVNDVLEFSRIEAGAITLEERSFSLAALVEDTLAIVAYAAQSKDLALTSAYEFDLPPWVTGDENRMRQILLNLLNNAVKFTRAGSVKLTVTRSSVDQWVRFTIDDTGIGIPADKQHLLFRRFSQVDASIGREFGGSGLGLAICERLVHAMQGEIGFKSREGQGSSFWFAVHLPPGQPYIAPAPVKPVATRNGEAAPILVVDDLPSNLEIVSSMLLAVGYRVETAADGEAAVHAVENGEFGLVLMDVQMPGLDGMAATRRIRDLPGKAAEVPIIAMTAYAFAEQIAQFLAAGMDGHVGKPFRKEELLGLVTRHVGAPPSRRPGIATRREVAPPFDQTLFDSFVEEMPAATAVRLLATFRRDIDVAFTDEPDIDRLALANRAHRIVASAGFLGFVALSERCKELEHLCRQPGLLPLPLAGVEACRAEAFAKLEELLKAMSARSADHAAE